MFSRTPPQRTSYWAQAGQPLDHVAACRIELRQTPTVAWMHGLPRNVPATPGQGHASASRRFCQAAYETGREECALLVCLAPFVDVENAHPGFTRLVNQSIKQMIEPGARENREDVIGLHRRGFVGVPLDIQRSYGARDEVGGFCVDTMPHRLASAVEAAEGSSRQLTSALPTGDIHRAACLVPEQH
jgi:hypothetical protein